MTALSDGYYSAVERRIEWLTLVAGVVGATFAGFHWNWKDGIGVAVGAFLSWINFRWLDQSIGALFQSVGTPSEAGPVHISRWIYARFVGRVILIVVAVYVILKTRWLPPKALLAGLFTLITAVLVEVAYEVFSGFRDPSVRT